MNIDACFKRLRDQSSLAQQVETRVIHTKVSEILTISSAGQLKTDLRYGHVHCVIPMPGTTSSEMPVLLSFERISNLLESVPFNPAQAFDSALLMRDRRRARGHILLEAMWTSPMLRDWVSSPSSAVLRVNDSFRRKEAAVDFALDMIQMAQTAGIPVIWYLGVDAQEQAASISAVDVLRSLARQLVEGPLRGKTGATGLSGEEFGDCETAAEWLVVLGSLVAMLDRIVVVIDARESADGVLSTVGQLKQKLDAQGAKVVCKILVLTCGVSAKEASALPILSSPPSLCSSSTERHSELDMDVFTLARVSRAPHSPRGRTRNHRNGGRASDQAKFSVQQLWDQPQLVHARADTSAGVAEDSLDGR